MSITYDDIIWKRKGNRSICRHCSHWLFDTLKHLSRNDFKKYISYHFYIYDFIRTWYLFLKGCWNWGKHKHTFLNSNVNKYTFHYKDICWYRWRNINSNAFLQGIRFFIVSRFESLADYQDGIAYGCADLTSCLFLTRL